MSEAFWTTWVRHRDYLLTLCLRWLNGNHADAEDALSRTALKAFESISGETSKVNNPKSWFTRIAHNISIDLRREHQRNLNAMEKVSSMMEDTADKFLPSSEQVIFLQRKEMRDRIDSAINTLPDSLKQPCILRFVMEMPYSEIADQLNLTNDNVRKRIQLARRQLRHSLNTQDPPQ